MLSKLPLLVVSAILGVTSRVAALGTNCSAPMASGTAAASDPFWMESIKHQGTAAYNSAPSTYVVFRNVKDYGAVGDGKTDDTAAINKAITDGSRCGGGDCPSSTVTPAVVYFPTGTYLVTAPIVPYYYTQMIGDAKNPPTLLAGASFAGLAVVDADVYIPGGNGAEWYTNQNNFFRSVRNFVIDLTQTPAASTSTGLHWQVSQATSLINVVVNMSTDPSTAHQGIFMENGSGGFMGDIVFNGGKFGMWVGNQQFTVRNITVSNAQTAVYAAWNWGWTFQGVTINNCGVGFEVASGGLTEDTQTTGSEAIIDGVINNTPIFIQSTNASTTSLAGALVLNNIKLSNVSTAVGVVGSTTAVLAGGSTTIDSWGQGNVYSGTGGTGKFTQDTITSTTKPSSLLDSSGKIFGRAHPQYESYAVDQFISVKTEGAKGDGSTDDTAALQAVFDKYSGCAIIFFDAGTYIVTDTLKVPAGTQMVGEAWTVIQGSGTTFSDQTKPTVMVQMGASGSNGTLEVTDMIFGTEGGSAGAIVVEWNVAEGGQGTAGMWDTHIRLGGADGTNLQPATCKNGTVNFPSCAAAFLGLHLTNTSTAYLEGTWVWTADHDLDGDGITQLSLFSGRGILSESAGPVWMIGTASEHHAMYQYSLQGAKNHYMGLIQSETPYYQPTPAAPGPFNTSSTYGDPTFSSDITSAWGLYVEKSSDIMIFGAGHYSFYQNYVQDCLNTTNCQDQIVSIDSGSSVNIYSLATVATTNQLSVDGKAVIKASDNVDGFQNTVTFWDNGN